jgi:tetratricopeptide (TPR) repeat protein
LQDTGRLPEGEKEFDQAIRIQEQLAADLPAQPDYRQELARSHFNRGNLLRLKGRPKDAEMDYNRAVSLYQKLAADFPVRPEFRMELASSHSGRGFLLNETGRVEEAKKDYDQALSLRKQLAADFPARPEYRQNLARSHTSRANLLSDAGQLSPAEQDYDQALSLYRQLTVDFPNQPELRNDVAGTCVDFALFRRRQGNWAVAKRLLLEGRPHHLAALNTNPKHLYYRSYYRDHLSALTAVHAGLLEPKDAVCTAETRRDLGWDAPADAYDAEPVHPHHGQTRQTGRQAAQGRGPVLRRCGTKAAPRCTQQGLQRRDAPKERHRSRSPATARGLPEACRGAGERTPRSHGWNTN